MDGSSALTLSHVRLLVDEYDACFRFYRDVLGFEVSWGDEEGGYADFDTGDVTLALFDRSAMAEAIDAPQEMVTGGDEVAVIFSVEAVDTVFDRLHADVVVVTEPHDQPGWGIRVAHFRDPDGTLIEINEPLEAS